MREAAHGLAGAAGTSRSSPPARATTTPGATSTNRERPPSTTAWSSIGSSWRVRSRAGRGRASRPASSRAPACRSPISSRGSTGCSGVPTLFRHLVVNADRYDAVILSPYLFWTTVTGATVVPERTIVMPCLHDEPYAARRAQAGALRRRAPLVPLRARARARARLRAVARTRRHRPAFTCPRATTRKDSSRHGLTSPFILFAGRREGGKGWDSPAAPSTSRSASTTFRSTSSRSA